MAKKLVENSKKIFYILLPILILTAVDARDNWNGWKTLCIYLTKTKAKAEIVTNPFYELIKSGKANDQYGDVDYEYLMDDNIRNNDMPIRFRYYDVNNVEQLDSIFYTYYEGEYDEGNYSFNEVYYQYSLFAESILDMPPGSKFDVYYYSGKSIPVHVYEEVLAVTGKVKIYFQSSFVQLLVLAMFFGVIIGFEQFGRKAGSGNK